MWQINPPGKNCRFWHLPVYGENIWLSWILKDRWKVDNAKRWHVLAKLIQNKHLSCADSGVHALMYRVVDDRLSLWMVQCSCVFEFKAVPSRCLCFKTCCCVKSVTNQIWAHTRLRSVEVFVSSDPNQGQHHGLGCFWTRVWHHSLWKLCLLWFTFWLILKLKNKFISHATDDLSHQIRSRSWNDSSLFSELF